MRKGILPAAIAALMLASPALGQEAGPHRVLPVGVMIDRLVHDAVGAPVGVVRDVVIVRDSGEALAVLEVLRPPAPPQPAAPATGQGLALEPPSVEAPPTHVVVPLPLLRLPPDGTVRLAASAPPLAALPPISVPPLAVAQGLMVPAPDAGPLRVIAPSPPPPSFLAAPPQVADQPFTR